MKKTFTFFIACMAGLASQAQFDPTSIIVLRVGNGTDSLKSSGARVFLDEFSPISGTRIQSVPLPTEPNGANKRCILGGTSTSEGMLQRSPSGLYLTVVGYDTAMGGPTPLNNTQAASINRSIARIAYDESMDITTGLTDFASNGNPRSVITTDGDKYWMLGGSSGVRFATRGSTTSTQLSTTPTNMRSIGFAGDQLCISTQSGSVVRIGAVGTGAPETGGNDITTLPGLPTSTGSPYQFVFFDFDASVPGPDLLYVANDDATAIQKYSLVGGTWVLNGQTDSDQDYRGLTGIVQINPADQTKFVALFSTRRGGSTVNGGGELVGMIDLGGYNTPFSGEPGLLLATADDSTSFRGVALAPLQVPLPLSLMSFTASKTSGGSLLVWTTNKEYNSSYFELQKSTDGRTYNTIDKQTAHGDDLYNEYRSVDRVVTTAVVYYRLKMVAKDGTVRYSQIVKMSSDVKPGFSVRPNPADASITIEHPLVKGKGVIRILMNDGRQVAAYTAPEGSFQTSLSVSQLHSGSYRLVFENGGTKLSTALLKK